MKAFSIQLLKLALATFVASGVVLLAGLLGAPQAEAQGAVRANPCPNFSIQNVFDDPNSDWDRDRVTNVVELNNGLMPCQPDSDQFCANAPSLCIHYTAALTCSGSTAWTWTTVSGDPNGDWDRDGITNSVEARNGANPCAHPCPYPNQTDLLLNPNGDWDHDGTSNNVEVYYGTNPCSAPVVTVTQRVVLPTYRYTVVTPTVYAAPYRGVPYVAQPPAGQRCPANNRYYNPTTLSCGTRPVVTRYY